MSNLDFSLRNESTIFNQFKNMTLLPAVDSNSLASSTAEKYTDFSGFVDGNFIQKVEVKNDKSKQNHFVLRDSFCGKDLCEVDGSYDSLISFASRSSAKGFKAWSSLSANSRSKILFKISQTIEKYQQQFTALESFSSGKHVHKVKSKDIPNLIESFDYYAGCALQLEDESKFNSWLPSGPVCVVPEEYNNPSLTLSLRVGSLLASGNSVLLLPHVKSSLSAFLLAEICHESGVPNGVLNVIPIEQDKIKTLGKLPIFSKVLITGSLEKCTLFSKLSSEAHIPCDVLIPRRPVVIVYENADLHSAANGVLEATFYHDTRSESGGSKVLIQESVYKKFLEILESRFSNILIGRNLSKTDLSCAVTEGQKEVLTQYIAEAKMCKAKITSLNSAEEDCNYTHILPVIISGLQTSCKLVHEEFGGPVIVTVPFRTVKESISMFNCDNKGSPVSVWTEKISVAIEVALKLRSGVVWVNSENVVDARTSFSGVSLSGNSVEGGKDAFYNHMSVLPETLQSYEEKVAFDQVDKYDAWLSSADRMIITKSSQQTSAAKGITEDKEEYKLYIGGIQKQSEKGTMEVDEKTLVPFGTESDIQSAVSSAVAVQPKWEAMTESQRRKFFLAILSKLKNKKQEYLTELQKVSGNSLDVCEKEIANTLDVLYYWGSQSEKFSGPMQEIKKNLIVLQNRNPLGVIGIQCPDEKPLLSFVSLIIPAIVFGNAVVALTSSKYPTLALKMCEIFTLSNIPGGVINVISGPDSCLIPALCKHMDVNAVWYTNVPSKVVLINRNITQRIFYCKGIWNSINEAKSLKFALESTFSKTIFLPAGEIFAN